MICPNCGEEMENRSRCGGLDDDDMGGPSNEWSQTRFVCKRCGITYSRWGEDYNTERWRFPRAIIKDSTEKQRHCIHVICSVLGLEDRYITNKKTASSFISEHMDESKKKSALNCGGDDWDYGDGDDGGICLTGLGGD